MFVQVWRNYFPHPAKAPPADPYWLAGINRTAMPQTRQAILRENPLSLWEDGQASTFPVLVLFGEHDIDGSETRRVAARYLNAAHVRLAGTVHLPWFQAPDRFAALLRSFYETAAPPASPQASQPSQEGLTS
jgi:pimeloyl-ACP methyl ester carboxylesterase